MKHLCDPVRVSEHEHEHLQSFANAWKMEGRELYDATWQGDFDGAFDALEAYAGQLLPKSYISVLALPGRCRPLCKVWGTEDHCQPHRGCKTAAVFASAVT